MELLALVRLSESHHRRVVRLPRTISDLSLKGDTKVKTTNPNEG